MLSSQVLICKNHYVPTNQSGGIGHLGKEEEKTSLHWNGICIAYYISSFKDQATFLMVRMFCREYIETTQGYGSKLMMQGQETNHANELSESSKIFIRIKNPGLLSMFVFDQLNIWPPMAPSLGLGNRKRSKSFFVAQKNIKILLSGVHWTLDGFKWDFTRASNGHLMDLSVFLQWVPIGHWTDLHGFLLTQGGSEPISVGDVLQVY